VLALSLMLALAAGPPSAREPVPLQVRDLTFDPLAGPPPVPRELRATRPTPYSIVQHEKGAGPKVAAAVRAAGGRVVGRVVRDALLVGGVPLDKLKTLPQVRFAGPYEPAYKLSADLRALRGPQRVELVVVVFSQPAQTAKAIAALGKRAQAAQTSAPEMLRVSLPAALLPQLAALPEVRAVEPAMMPLPELDEAPVRIGVRAAPGGLNYDGLDGAGQILGVYDTGGDTGDPGTLIPDLRGRLEGDTDHWTNRWVAAGWQDATYTLGPSTHGTRVLDVAMGNGSGSDGGVLKGIAPAATGLIRPFRADADGGTPGFLNITQALDDAWDYGARVHNNSWVPATGNSPNLAPVLDQYSVQGSAAIDLFAQTNPDMLIVTSAGNYGTRDGGSRVVGTLSCSKNSLAVGNSGNGNPPTGQVPGYGSGGVVPNQMAPSSSGGPVPPASAPRLKPDVCAPGASIAAACSQNTMAAGECPDQGSPPYRNQPGYAYQTGTSFSAPQASGAGLLIRQWFSRDQITPSGMLVKAVLVNGASQLFPYVPGNFQGWGGINLQRSLSGQAGAGRLAWYDSFHAPGARFAFLYPDQAVEFEGVDFTVGQPLAITLTWYDWVDASFSGALVNDLDLTITDGTTTYKGGVPSMTNGVTVAGGAADHNNNTEKIVLAAAPAGRWTITVTAYTADPDTPQYFALAVMPFRSQTPPQPGKAGLLTHH
jgi:hypothetical protein